MTIIPREQYGHPGPLGPALDLSRVSGWDFHHTAGGLNATPYSIASYGHQKFGRSSYNFLNSQVDHPGDVFEMQGLHIGAHNDGQNSTRLGLVFVGYYHPSVHHRLTDEQAEAAAALMAHGLEHWGVPIHAKGHRDPDIGSGDTDGTACPGDHIHDQIPSIVARARALAGGATPNDDEDENMLIKGDKGNAVRRFQTALLNYGGNREDYPWTKARGYGADGKFGKTTEEMVKDYQRAADLDVTGRIDGVTASLLMEYVTDHVDGWK